MQKVRTLTQLQDALDKDMSWRIREISTLKVSAKSGGITGSAFVRAGIALVYAHWEGFVKSSSEIYLNYIDSQGHLYRDLKSCFVVFGLKGKLSSLTASRKAKSYVEAFDFILGEMDQTAKMKLGNAIDTESNLTSKVFTNIALSLDISITPYETKFNLIDESLVSRRNKVAHGEYLDLGTSEFMELADEVLQLMRDYKTDLQNAASMSSYKRPIPEAGHAV